MLNGKAYLPFIYLNLKKKEKKNSKMKEKKIIDSVTTTFILRNYQYIDLSI